MEAIQEWSEKEAAAGLHPPPPGAHLHRAASAPHFRGNRQEAMHADAGDFPLGERLLGVRVLLLSLLRKVLRLLL